MPPLKNSQSNGQTYGQTDGQTDGQAYWRSLDELAHTERFNQFIENEFPHGAQDAIDSCGRRQFLKVMAASFALAGLTSCRRWPEEKIVPYSRRPAGRMPGVPVQYATAMELGGAGLGLLVTSFDGRPIKIDGNNQHPLSAGAAGPLVQSGILDFYDPDRARTVRQGRAKSSWESFNSWLEAQRETIDQTQGAKLRVLCEATSSPSAGAMRKRMQAALPNMVWHEYESVSDDNERFGASMAFGAPYRPHYMLEHAKVIVSLDADFLERPTTSPKYIRDFAASRRLDNSQSDMSRMYAFESMLSLTGANADQRVALRSSDIAIVAARLAVALLGDASPAIRQLAARQIDAQPGEEDLASVLDKVALDLKEHRGHGIVTVGLNQPPQVHLLAHLINDAIGAVPGVGNTVKYTPLSPRQGHRESLASLVKAIEKDEVQTLLIIGGNPAYDAPADLHFADAIAKVEQTIRLSDYDDETAALCTWFLPRAHYLEAWGDVRAIDGTVSVCQPLIEPLFGGHSTVELLATFCNDPLRSGEKIVERTFAELTGGTFSQTLWRKTLHDGLLAKSAYPTEQPRVDLASAQKHLQSYVDGAEGAGESDRDSRGAMELLFVADSKVYDGRFANNGWLQELPDPLTKLTWDNAALLSVTKARQLGVEDGDVISLTVGKLTMELPILAMPGQHERCVVVALGYGRRFKGRVCAGAGFDVGKLRTTASFFQAQGVRIAKTGRKYPLATTQSHHAIDVASVAGKSQQDRLGGIFREADLNEYRADPHFTKHRVHVPHQLSPFDETNLEGATHRWAMSIDLGACVGCNACVAACHAENNIPIVGKDQVLRGREMHWIRLDRYYSFGKTNGHYDASKLKSVAMQPMTCQMCENAACEQVCPVGATMHDKDGLNLMIYNRCVGTRYCSNNCPYKVRRFNYFDYWKRKPHRTQPGTLLQVDRQYYAKPQAGANELRQLQFNPEVTVRMRGVMEKCTFCTQRIEAAKIQAKNQWVQAGGTATGNSQPPLIPDGTIKTACQESCPAGAIIFGDLKDPTSDVAKLHSNERSYMVLEELNAKPRVKYLAKITNPIPAHEHASSNNDHS